MSAVWTNEEIELVAERGYQLHLQGKNADALTIFEGLLAIDPRNVYCLEALAALNLKLGLPERAIDYASRALAFSPREIEALACRCEALILLSRFDEAQKDLESLRQFRAETQVVRLTMRLANAKKSSPHLLTDATLRQLGR